MSPNKRVLTVTAASLLMAGFSVGPVFAETQDENSATVAPELTETSFETLDIEYSDPGNVANDFSILPLDQGGEEGEVPPPTTPPPGDGGGEEGEVPPPTTPPPGDGGGEDEEDDTPPPTTPPPGGGEDEDDEENETPPPPPPGGGGGGGEGETPGDNSQPPTDIAPGTPPGTTAPEGTPPGTTAPEGTPPVPTAGGGGDNLAATGVDMSGFVLGGAVVTGIGALALWAGSRRPGMAE